ncbi:MULTISPECIES: oligosaccharide flippase family protein [unclassified Endozoicomonas]|uniref:oligosaccharide flippase family protein n=1 Tax=unclassified Endozoicomonas TaxID=2644528 RepID=UPI003BB628BD
MLQLFLRDSLIYGLASILSRSLGLLLLPIYTRILEPQDYGVFDLITTAAVFINLVLALEIGQGLARYWNEVASKNQQIILASTAWWFSVFFGLIFLIFSFYYSEKLNKLIFNYESYLSIFKTACIFLYLNCLFYILLNQLRWDMQSKKYAAVSFINAALIFTLGITFSYYRNMGLLGIVTGQAFAALLSILLCLVLLRKSIILRLNFSKLVLMLKFSIPLVPAALATFITLYVNRLALNAYGSLDEIGIYGAASRLASVVAIMAFGVQSALTPLIYVNYKKARAPSDISSIFHVFLAVSLLLTLIMSVYASEILIIMVGHDYSGAVALIPYLTIGLLFSQLYPFFPGITIHKKTIWQLIVSILTATVSFILNYSLVPIYGMLGAAISMLVSYIFFLSFWVFLSQKLYPINIRWKDTFITLFTYLLVIFLSVKLSEFIVSYYLLFLIKTLLVIMFLLTLLGVRMIPLLKVCDVIKFCKNKDF